MRLPSISGRKKPCIAPEEFLQRSIQWPLAKAAGERHHGQEKRRQWMTPEEMQRMMDFLLAQQARFDARLEKEHEERREADAQLRESDERLRGSDERLRESDERLRESQATLTAVVARIADLVEELTEAQKSTDERLNALIGVVEKHIAGPGHSSPPRQ
jgi:chromosome segregation ATPase